MNHDELMAKMAQDELEDELKEALYTTPIRFAKANGLAPQSVYYKIRSGKLTSMSCPSGCGCRVVEIDEANDVFGLNQDKIGKYDQDEYDDGIGHEQYTEYIPEDLTGASDEDDDDPDGYLFERQ